MGIFLRMLRPTFDTLSVACGATFPVGEGLGCLHDHAIRNDAPLLIRHLSRDDADVLRRAVLRNDAATGGGRRVLRGGLRCERGCYARFIFWMDERGGFALGERAERFGGLAAEQRHERVVGVEDAAVCLVHEDGAREAFTEVAQAEGVLRVRLLLGGVAQEAVLAFALRRVERCVGVMRELEERCAVFWRGGVAERDRERFFCALIAERLRVRRELREEFVRAPRSSQAGAP